MDRTPGFENLYDSSEDEEQKKKEEETQQAKDKRLSLLERLSSKDTGEEKVTLKRLFEDKPEKDVEKTKSENEANDKPETETDEPTAIETEQKPERSEISEQEIDVAVSEIMQEHIEERLATLSGTADNATEGSVAKAQAEASKELLEAVDERLKSGEQAFNPVVEAEFQRLKDEALTKLSEQEGDEELAPDNVEADSVQPISLSELSPETPKQTIAKPSLSKATPTPSPALSSPAVPSASSSQPSSPLSGGTNVSGSGGSSSGGNGNFSPPVGTAENTAGSRSEDQEKQKERSKRSQAFVAGGVLGYMVGRRGGRKRTEAKLNPKIEELETEVAAAKKNLSEKEQKLQRIVAASFRNPDAPPTAQRTNPESESTTIHAETTPEKTPPKPVREVLRRAVEVPMYLQNSEINEKTETQLAPQTNKQEVIQAKVQRLETLSTPEILAEAQHFFAGGTNVRRLYETNQIDRKGLIYLVKEGYRGKDLRKAFEKVELGRERQRERAREFRHDDPSFSTSIPDDQQTSSTLAAAATLPNQPDQSSVQPIAPILPPLNAAEENIIQKPQSSPVKNNTPSLNRFTTPIAAILATAIALLILFLLF